MRKIAAGFTLCVLTMMYSSSANSVTLKLASSPEPPVSLEKGWNLISVPCDIDAASLKKGNSGGGADKKKDDGIDASDNANGKSDIANNEKGENQNPSQGNSENSKGNSEDKSEKTTRFYSWNGENYEEVDFLRRGVGYIVNTNNIVNSSSVCAPSEAAEPMEIELKKGWNLVGNPYHQAYKVKNIFGSAFSYINVIYEFVGNKYSILDETDHFKPWRGYWAYVDNDVSVNVFKKCSLSISAEKLDVVIGELVPVEATYTCESEMGVSESYDVTSDAAWTSDEGGGVESGMFSRLVNRAIPLKAKYKGLESNALVFPVSSDFECEKVVVVQKYDTPVAPDGDCVHFTKLNGNLVYDGEQCHMCGNNSDIFCRDIDGFSDKIQVFWNASEVRPKAYCVESSSKGKGDIYKYESYKEVTDDVKWTSAGYSKGVNTGVLRKGNYTSKVFAKYKAIKSLPQVVVMSDIDEMQYMKFENYSITVGTNQEYQNRVYAYYYQDRDGKCGANRFLDKEKVQYKEYGHTYYHPWGCLEDVTDKVEITEMNNVVSYKNGVITAGENPGKGNLTVSYQGREAFLSMQVLDSNGLVSISISPSYVYSSVGQKHEFKVTGVYNKCSRNVCNKFYKDVTDKVGFITSANVKYENGKIVAGSEVGKGVAHAVLAGKSAEMTIYITKPNIPMYVYFSRKSTRMNANESTGLRFFATYYRPDANCKGYRCEFVYDDVTENATYVYDDRLISYKNGTVTAGSKTVMAEIYGTYEGYTAKAEVQVIRTDFIQIEISAPEKNNLMDCPASEKCFITHLDKPMKLTVYSRILNSSDQANLTKQVTWEISDATKATISSDGQLKPLSAGMIWIRAGYKGARSDKTWVAIADDNNKQFLFSGLGTSRNLPIMVGSTKRMISAIYEYGESSMNFIKYIIDPEKIVFSDDSLFLVEKAKSCHFWSGCLMLTAENAGITEIYTEYKGLKSNTVSLETWKNEKIDRCDQKKPNVMFWDDNFLTRVSLETDCATYEKEDRVSIVYTANVYGGESRVVDNCLDLWVIDDNDKIVKTFRNEGCSTEPIGRNASRATDTIFQKKYEWDMIGDDGKKVPPGNYYATARFYIIYEPVIHTPFTIKN